MNYNKGKVNSKEGKKEFKDTAWLLYIYSIIVTM